MKAKGTLGKCKNPKKIHQGRSLKRKEGSSRGSGGQVSLAARRDSTASETEAMGESVKRDKYRTLWWGREKPKRLIENSLDFLRN